MDGFLATAGAAGEPLLWLIEVLAWAIELLAVAIIVVAIFSSMADYLWQRVRRLEDEDPYGKLKIRLGRSLLLGLEILVAADIVRTVALEATLESVLVLGLLVVIRTFLSWALVVEIEGHWPWHPTDSGEPTE